MILFWTKSNLPLSKLITWGLNEPVSHFAFCFDNALVIHSDLLGIGIKGINSFKKSHEIVYTLPLELTTAEEEALYYKIIFQFDDRPYDYKAFAFFCYRAALFKTFGSPMPRTSPWNQDRAYLCTELAGLLPGWNNELDLSITSPYKLYLFMKLHQQLTQGKKSAENEISSPKEVK